MSLRLCILIVVCLSTVILSSCANHPTSYYKPATHAGYGYKQKLLGENYYRVEFTISTGTTSDSAKKAKSYALLRAAEITTSEGYDWFLLTRQDIKRDKERPPISNIHSRPVVTQSCGLLGCRSIVHTAPDFTVEQDTTSEDVTAIIEIKLGRGVRPSLDNTYDARETYDALKEH
ncbi:MAG: hypothetical protein EOO68_18585 [Moraxellaceae bacterium]|nr:MAG: hypothetical protein EOO68_18585 [Moraxellaceae bacterium]